MGARADDSEHTRMVDRIRATAFKNECDKFEPMVQEDKVIKKL